MNAETMPNPTHFGLDAGRTGGVEDKRFVSRFAARGNEVVNLHCATHKITLKINTKCLICFIET